MVKKTILLKLTGTIFIDPKTEQFARTFIDPIVDQIKILSKQYQFGIVIGGGDFFRGSRDNDTLKLSLAIAHTIGMIGTTINGLMLYDLLHKKNIANTVLCAIDCPIAGNPITQEAIDNAIAKNKIIIFSGGTGNPYISTDTNAIIRAQQMGASEIWKATDVDGVYTADPHKNKKAQFLKKVSYADALKKDLQFMDRAALILAQEAKITTRMFNIFSKNVLLTVAKDKNFGTIINKG